MKSSYLAAASTVSDKDTPKRLFLKRGVCKLLGEVEIKNKKLKSLQQSLKRANKKIATLKSIIVQLKNQNLLTDDASDILLESFGKYKDLITNWSKKNINKKCPKKYSPTVRQFALSLHLFSAKAYNYVRKQFNTILPHARTLSKWYSHVDAKPGFTNESLKNLALKVKCSTVPVVCTLMLDEMAIRQHIEFDGKTYYGGVDLGTGMDNDNLEKAKQCLVFMVVSINENWKIPIGYFLITNLNGSQKAELTKHALNLLKDTGISVVSLTFDGCSSNLTMARLLGCDLNISTLKTKFDDVVIFLDAAHMIKLVRNAFGDREIFKDSDGNLIDFNFVKKLFVLQENEGCHMANKLRKSHIFFFKQKMKVKLASQLLSQSVADALKFCKYNLGLEEFENVDGTVKFIEMFNTGFDILNSRSIRCFENKKAICDDNIEQIIAFTDLMTNYIKGLKVKEKDMFVPILDSNRRTGFFGFIVCLNSALSLYESLIKPKKIDHIKMYKTSQDHLELFFGSVRALGGFNNNPTSRQFQSAYKKLVVHPTNIENFNTGNCIPLENIDILHYSSSDPIKTININTINHNIDSISREENVQEVDSYINDHDYIFTQNITSNFSKEVTIYIAGFVVHKLSSTINCETCLHSLCSNNKELLFNSLIHLKNRGGDKGGLIYPSDDVIIICLQTEKILKSYNFENQKINSLYLQSKVLYHFYNSNIFNSLKSHSSESNSPLSDHVTLLIKSISSTYIKLKVNYNLKSHNETTSLRMWYNKLTLFKGQ